MGRAVFKRNFDQNDFQVARFDAQSFKILDDRPVERSLGIHRTPCVERDLDSSIERRTVWRRNSGVVVIDVDNDVAVPIGDLDTVYQGFVHRIEKLALPATSPIACRNSGAGHSSLLFRNTCVLKQPFPLGFR